MKTSEGLIIDWMDGRHLQFEKYEEAKKAYNKMLEQLKSDDCEIDIQLFKLTNEYCNIKN